MKYHYIYKITRISNGAYYIGRHSTRNLDDKYFGSGTQISALVEMLGRDAFVMEILELLPDLESLKKREKEIVNTEFLKLPGVLNLKEGGDGGWDHINNNSEKKKQTQSKRLNASNRARLEKLKNDEVFRKWYGKRISDGVKNKYPNGKPAPNAEGFSEKCHRMSRTPKAMEKKKKTFAERQHQQGEKNSQFGTMWITDGSKNKKIKNLDIIPDGWRKGRKCK